MRRMNAAHFKAHCLAVLDDVRRTGESVIVLKRGKVVVRVSPAYSSEDELPQKSLFGTVHVLGDIVAPAMAPEEWEANAPTPTRRVLRASTGR